VTGAENLKTTWIIVVTIFAIVDTAIVAATATMILSVWGPCSVRAFFGRAQLSSDMHDPGVYFPVFIPNTEQTIEGLPSLMSGLPVFSEAVPRRQDAAQDDSQGIIACESAFAALENVEIDDKLTGLGPCVDADVLPVLRTLVDVSLYCSTRVLPPGEIE